MSFEIGGAYTPRQVASMLNVDQETVKRWIRDGSMEIKLGYSKNGDVIGYEEIEKFIKNNPQYCAPLLGIMPNKGDQKAKADYGKEQLCLVPRRIIHDIAAIRMYGNLKYGDPENWRTVEVQRYRDAAYRHWLAYLDDPYGVDAESEYPHLWHLACNIAFLCEMEDAELQNTKD